MSVNNLDVSIAQRIVTDLEQLAKNVDNDITSRGGYADCPTASRLLGFLMGALAIIRTGNERSFRELESAIDPVLARAMARIEDAR